MPIRKKNLIILVTALVVRVRFRVGNRVRVGARVWVRVGDRVRIGARVRGRVRAMFKASIRAIHPFLPA